MTAPPSSQDIETAPPPAVSSLRSRFEKLAAGSSASPTASLKPSPAPTHSFIPPASIPSSPRLKPTPTPEHDRDLLEQHSHFLHPSHSTSELRTVGKRPPPPPPSPLRPPSRTPSPAPPRSPLLRPASPAVTDPDTSQDSLLAAPRVAALARRPPPPPPPSQDHSGHRVAPVSSLIKQFGNGTPPPTVTPPRLPISTRPTSQVLISGLTTPEPPEPPYSRRPRQSLPPDLVSHSGSTNSLLSVNSSSPSDGFDPFDDIHSDTESPQPPGPPPLPRRHGSFASHTPESSSGAAAQGTNAVCNTGFDWMSNSKGQSPCLISSWLFTPCSSPADSWVYPLSPGYHYNTPLNNPQSATPCRCNTVLFSTIAACATCQGQEDYIVPWSTYSQNCSTIYVQKYPATIPSGTSIPAWAYLDITANNTFNPSAAQAVASQNAPDSTAPVTASQTSSATSLTAPPSATGSSNGAPTTGENSGSSSKSKSNVGAIVGGVVGGIGGLALIGIAVFFILRSRRNAARNQPTGPVDLTANGNYGQYQPQYANYGADMQYGEKSPVAPQSDPSQPLMSNQRLYDPNDPTTFPTQDPYAGSVQVSTGYPTTEHTTAASNQYTEGYQGSVSTNQNPTYRGAPEL